jgi:hypothetical protein
LPELVSVVAPLALLCVKTICPRLQIIISGANYPSAASLGWQDGAARCVMVLAF